MKRKLLIGMVLVMVIILLSACGIPQQDYDAIVAERDTAQADVSSLQSELAGVQSELDDTKSALTTVESRLATVLGQIENLENDVSGVNSKLATANLELSTIKKVYPPGDFSSISELRNWLLKNDISERSSAEYAETLYTNALNIQEDALNDGYIVSVNIEYDSEADAYIVACVTIINGDLWIWDPANDEPINYSALVGFQEVR